MTPIDDHIAEGFPGAFSGPAAVRSPLVRAFTRSLQARIARAACVLIFLLAARSLSAFGNAAITGTIFGPAKVPIPGAKVTLTAADGSRRTVIADQQGHYSFSSVEPSTYALSAEAAGYGAVTRAGVEITAGTSITVDLLLPAAGAPGPNGATTAPPAYYDDTSLKAGAVTSATDESGYSSQAQSPKRLLKEGPSLAGNATKIPLRKPGTPEAAETERELREALQASPNRFETNHQLGEFYLSVGDLKSGIPYLEKAQELKPGDYSNGCDLAAAYLAAKDPAKAEILLEDLSHDQDTAELHNLRGQVEEARGDSVTAVKEFRLAAQMDPNEQNLFAWGDELLLHDNIESALDVFRRGVGLYPQSSRMYIGLGLALYSHNSYNAAIEALCHASDLDPSDPRPYLFLGKMYNVSTGEANEVATRMQRFMQTNPDNAFAYYYGALSLWKGSRNGEEGVDTARVEALLRKSVALDPRLADAHLQLAILYHDLQRDQDAIPEFQTAIRLRPDDADTHYRLAQVYIRAGDKARGQEELQVYDKLRKQQADKKQNGAGDTQRFSSPQGAPTGRNP